MEPTDNVAPGTTGAPATANAPESLARASRGLILGSAFAVAALWFFIRLADEVMESETQKIDSGIILFFRTHSSAAVHSFMAGVTWAASGSAQTVLIIAAALLFLWLRRFWPDGITILVAGFGGMLLDEGLKRLFHRQRPEAVFYHLGYSFPSGHALSAVVIYGLLAYWISREVPVRWRIVVWTVAVLLMLLVGFSRVCLAQHYPTDVIGGYLAGVCWLWGCIGWLSILDRRTAHARLKQRALE